MFRSLFLAVGLFICLMGIECLFVETAVFTTADFAEADLVVGAVLIPGAKAPCLIEREQLGLMKPGSVLIDVAIDQGGCVETSRPTSHSEPTFLVDQVLHYCVTNMPGAVPSTAAFALNNATLPYLMRLAKKGYQTALQEDPHFRDGLNVCHGRVTHPAVARDLGYAFTDPEVALALK